MPTGIYKRTKEHKRKISEAKKGKKYPNRKKPEPFTEEHKKRISENSSHWNLGRHIIHSGTFKKGHLPYLLKHTEETKKKISLANKGKPASAGSFKKGHKPFANAGMPKGFKHTEETKLKMSLSAPKGKNHPLYKLNKGRFGKLSPRWIEDRTLLAKRQERNDSAYAEWRKLVWLRDNFKCKINNSDCDGRIIAHHILSWKEYPELRYNVNNGITLCQAHHPRKRAEEKRLILDFQELVSVSN